MSDKTIKCPQCEGKGLWITESNPEGRTCVNCDGKGFITNPNKEQRTDLKVVAEQTLKIVAQGYYYNLEGEKVSLSNEVAKAFINTEVIYPAMLNRMYDGMVRGDYKETTLEITNENTQQAAKRLAEKGRTVLLNFASAKSPGGGFINGRIAQEEDLCRCSALYDCLKPQREYYDIKHENALYSRHLIYSPDVPFFKTNGIDLPSELFLASVITSAAPNAGAYLDSGGDPTYLRPALLEKVRDVLTIAKVFGYRNVVLGAWGCGVFRNDPKEVAAEFKYWLDHESFQDAFDNVVFPVYSDKTGELTKAFEKELFNR